jgi:hypothetical protein
VVNTGVGAFITRIFLVINRYYQSMHFIVEADFWMRFNMNSVDDDANVLYEDSLPFVISISLICIGLD